MLWEVCVGEEWERREERRKIREDIAWDALLSPLLIREWFADFYPVYQFTLKIVLVLFDSQKMLWTGLLFFPLQLGQTQVAGLGWKLGATSGNA